MTTARDLIESSYRAVGIVDPTEPMSAKELSDGLEALNWLLDNSIWANQVKAYASVKRTHTLTPSDADYTIGSGGDIDQARPDKIIGAFVASGDTDYPLDIISEQQYRNIDLKSISGIPYCLFYHPENPLGIIYLYYVPDSAYVLHFWGLEPLTTLTNTATIDAPASYMRALKWNLAKELMPEHGIPLSQLVHDNARDSMDNIISLNAANQVSAVGFEIDKQSKRGSGTILNY